MDVIKNIFNIYLKVTLLILSDLIKNQCGFLSKTVTGFLTNRFGFSIVGVLIAASVGTFVVLGLTKSQFYLLKNTQKIESKMKALELTKEIISTLEAPAPDCMPPCTWSKSSCTNTLQGFNDVASTEIVKTAILSATHQTDQPTTSNVYAVSTNYNGVQIKEMKLVSENTGDDIVILRVWFETDEDIEQGRISPEMARPFDIYAKVNYVGSSNTVESCTAVITSYSTFSGKACADGEYLKGFDNIGVMKCVPLPKCADNEYLSGFDNVGNKICRISHRGQSCGSGQYLRGFDTNGNKNCENFPPINTITSYSDSCTICNRTTTLGTHLFCILSGVSGPGGLNTACQVFKAGNVWKLKTYDSSDSSQTQRCHALCFD